jgi:hypothetical protein
MKILSWNCRGLSRPAAVRSLRMLIRDSSPNLLFLSETKSSPSHVTSILNRLGFYSLTQVPPLGSKGGLVLSWRLGIDIECFITNKHNISAWIFSDPVSSPWIISCLYGPPDKRDKPVFWDSLITVGDGFASPWLCIGDLNHVLDQTKKLGGRLVASSSNCPFKGFIDHFGLVDLGFSGNPFTWCNQRQGNDTIKERLDRGIANLSWIHVHPEFTLKHIPSSNSGHHPILLDTDHPSSNLPRPFRFEEFWTKDPSCGAVVDAAWKNFVNGSPAHCLVKKQHRTKASLLRWNHSHFGNIQAKIKSTLSKLDHIQQTPHSFLSFSEEQILKTDLDDLLLKEEILWRSKSRENWLTCNDLNTKFFHSSTIIRRRSNAINFLKYDEGIWLLI